MSKATIAIIFAVCISLALSCSTPTGHCSTPCSTNFPSNGKCNYAPMIARHEGCCECTYLDSLGKPTIGIGYLMVPSRASQLQSVGANYESLVAGHSQLNMEQITQLFNIYVQSSITVAQHTYTNWNKLCCNVEQALVDIIYDLNNGISAFHTFNGAINSENWSAAAAALQNSLFCKQVGQRCTDDANLIKQGCPKNGSGNQAGNPSANSKANSNAENSNAEKSNAENSNASSSAKSSAQASNPNASGSQASGSQASGSQASGSQASGSQASGSQASGSGSQASGSNSQASGSGSQASGSGSQASGSGSQASASGSGSASQSGSSSDSTKKN